MKKGKHINTYSCWESHILVVTHALFILNLESVCKTKLMHSYLLCGITLQIQVYPCLITLLTSQQASIVKIIETLEIIHEFLKILTSLCFVH